MNIAVTAELPEPTPSDRQLLGALAAGCTIEYAMEATRHAHGKLDVVHPDGRRRPLSWHRFMSMTRAGYVTQMYLDDKRVARYHLSMAGKNYLADNPRATDIDKYIAATK